MAVARTQYPVADLTRRPREHGVHLRFGITRWPGGWLGS
jgi:NAD/NADP transhydrogenase beta subunit